MSTPLPTPLSVTVASVGALIRLDTDNKRVLQFSPTLHDASGKLLPVLSNPASQPRMTERQQADFFAATANAGETVEQFIMRAALPYLTSIGLVAAK